MQTLFLSPNRTPKPIVLFEIRDSGFARRSRGIVNSSLISARHAAQLRGSPRLDASVFGELEGPSTRSPTSSRPKRKLLQTVLVPNTEPEEFSLSAAELARQMDVPVNGIRR